MSIWSISGVKSKVVMSCGEKKSSAITIGVGLRYGSHIALKLQIFVSENETRNTDRQKEEKKDCVCVCNEMHACIYIYN